MTQRPQRPQRQHAGFLSVLCELCVHTSYLFAPGFCVRLSHEGETVR